MADLFNPARDGHALDKLRHNDPKTARTMIRAGGRFQQYAALAAREGNVGVTAEAMAEPLVRAVGLGDNITAKTTMELAARWQTFRGQRRSNEALKELLDTHEQQQSSPTSVVPINAEAANMLRDLQTRLKLPSQLETVKRLAETHERSMARAEQLREKETTIRDLKAQLAAGRDFAHLAAEHDRVCKDAVQIDREYRALQKRAATLEEKLAAAERGAMDSRKKNAALLMNEALGPQAAPAVQDALFDFVRIFTGATATADPSGEIVVNVSPGQLTEMFMIWARAVKLLDLSSQVGD